MQVNNEAIIHFTEVLRIRPDSIGAHGYIGFALASTEHKEEAIPHLKELSRVRPDNKVDDSRLKTAQALLKEKLKRSANVRNKLPH